MFISVLGPMFKEYGFYELIDFQRRTYFRVLPLKETTNYQRHFEKTQLYFRFRHIFALSAFTPEIKYL